MKSILLLLINVLLASCNAQIPAACVPEINGISVCDTEECYGSYDSGPWNYCYNQGSVGILQYQVLCYGYRSCSGSQIEALYRLECRGYSSCSDQDDPWAIYVYVLRANPGDNEIICSGDNSCRYAPTIRNYFTDP